MKVTLMQRCQKEINELKKNGVIKAEDIVAFAKNPKTALHSQFEWNNTKAAHEYRLWQARQLIVRVMVSGPDNKPIQAFDSLKSDRYAEAGGGGYRPINSVLTTAQLREELLQQALEELEYFRLKYQSLTELAAVFSAAQRVKSRLKRKAG